MWPDDQSERLVMLAELDVPALTALLLDTLEMAAFKSDKHPLFVIAQLTELYPTERWAEMRPFIEQMMTKTD